MAAPIDYLGIGNPRFEDASIANIAKHEGLQAAWQTALRQSPIETLLNVSGSFAVGIQEPGRAIMASDRFATRSLCYRVIDGALFFSERADELASLAPKADIDTQALFDYFFFHVIPSPRTVFEGVYRLPAAHWARRDGEHLEVSPYWTPKFTSDASRQLDLTAAQFRRLVRDAVSAELDESRPACFLSGGTDSSTVAGMVSAVAGSTDTYSIGFDAEGYDEMAFARIAARHFGTRHHEYYVTPSDVAAALPAVAAHHDQPFGNSSAVPTYFCARMAREDGVTRLLAGDGGDELFGGNTRYAKQMLFELYNFLPRELRHSAIEPALLAAGPRKLPILRKAASYVSQARVPLPDRLQTYNLLTRIGASDVLTSDFLARVDEGEPSRQQAKVWDQSNAENAIDRMLALDWRYTLAESDLPKVTGAAALAGVSVGFPFLNRFLVDFSMTLPPDYKVRRLKLRWFFKEALRDFLPREILRKRKQGFGLPFGPWATRHTGLKRLAGDSLRSLGTRNVVRPDFVDRLLGDLLPAHPGFYGEMVWILAVLEQWLRRHRPDYRL